MTTLTEEPRIDSEIGPTEYFGALEDVLNYVPLAKDYCEALEPTTAAPHQYHIFALFNIIGIILGRGFGLHYAGTDLLYAPHYTLLVGPTHSSHKSTALNAAERMLNEATGFRIAVTGASGSGEGLLEALAYASIHDGNERDGIKRAIQDQDMAALRLEDRGQRRLLVVQDEFSTIIRKARADSSILSTTLMELHGCPAQYRHPTRKNPILVYHPILSVLAASTFDRLQADLDSSHWSDGFMNRIAIVHANPYRDLARAEGKVDADKWEKVCNHLRMLYQRSKDVADTPVELVWGDDGFAGEEWDGWYNDFQQEQRGREAVPQAALRRIPDNTLRFALIVAMLNHPDQLEITAKDIQYAVDMGEYLKKCGLRLVESLTTNDRYRMQERILRAIFKHETVSTRELVQSTRVRTHELLRDYLEPMDGVQVVGGAAGWSLTSQMRKEMLAK